VLLPLNGSDARRQIHSPTWEQWNVERITDLAVNAEGTMLVTISPDRRIRTYSTETMRETSAAVVEGDNVTSLSMSNDGSVCLVNVSSETHPEVHLWDLQANAATQRYRGHRQGRFILRSAFGGVRECYVVSGSEDSLVYLWHRESAALLATLRGHSGIHPIIDPHSHPHLHPHPHPHPRTSLATTAASPRCPPDIRSPPSCATRRHHQHGGVEPTRPSLSRLGL
jgi:WD40 repeat protein